MASRTIQQKKFNRVTVQAARRKRARDGVDVRGRAIPFQGIIVKKTEVKNHRYLEANGFEFSKRLAGVSIKSTIKDAGDREVNLSPRKGFRSKALSSPRKAA